MSKSQRLRLGDLTRIIRLIGECRDLAYDWQGWRRHLASSLRPLVGAAVVISGEAHGYLTGSCPTAEYLEDQGWAGSHERDYYLKFMEREEPDRDPLFARLLARLRRSSGTLTRHRRELVDDRQWRRSVFLNEYHKPARLNECLYSYCTLPSLGSDVMGVIELHLAQDGQAVGERGRQLVQLLHQEIRLLIGKQLAGGGKSPISELPRRLRETLQCLLQGDSEKQAALRLGLSRPTIHEYVTALYRHFGVHSRAELLAHWLRLDRRT